MSRRTIWIISIIVVLAVLGLVWFWLVASGGRNLVINLSGPDSVLIGVPFTVSANVSNSTSNVLQNVQLSLELPEGVVFLGSGPDRHLESRNLGQLGTGSLLKEDFQLLVLKDENSIKRLTASVSYIPNAISARFEKNTTLDLAVRESALVLDLAAPTKVFNREDFAIKISYRNIANVDFADLKLTANYPSAFNFKSSSLTPDEGENIWYLGSLRSGSETDFTVTGNLIGPANSFFEFPASVEALISGRLYTIAAKSASLAIAPSPLVLDISVSGDADGVVYPRNFLDYTLNYANNTDVGLRDVIIKAQLTGAIFDFTTISSNQGILSPTDNTIFWRASTVPQLASLAPGASGSVAFRVQVGNYPIRRLSDKNFTVKVTGEIESPTVPPFVAADKTVGAAVLENKVGGQIKVETKALFRDAASGILNSGSLPLKVGKPTNFTIHWLITNSAVEVKDVEVRAFLGGNVRFTGVIKSDIPAQPIYNERTQEMVWHIDKITANRGVLDKPLEAVFQVEATPAIDQLGGFMTLLRETSIKATDEFTGLSMTGNFLEVTTELRADPTVTSGQGMVVQ